MKKLITLLLVLTGMVCTASATDIYLKPGNNWSSGSAIFKLYVFDSSNNKWFDFDPLDGYDGYYKATIDEDAASYTNMIIVRLNPGDTDKSYWDRKWTQTVDLEKPSNNTIYYIYDDASTSSDNGAKVGTDKINFEELGYKIYYGTDNQASTNRVVVDMIPEDNGYEFSYTFDNQTATGEYYFMILSNSNVKNGNDIEVWEKVLFPVPTSGALSNDNPVMLDFSNKTGNVANSQWCRWGINNIPAKFVISFNRIAATWSVSPYFTRDIDGYATFSSAYNVAIPDGVTAFYATAAETGKVTMTSISDGIPAETGAFLKADNGTYKFVPATSTESTVSPNLLVAGTSAGVAASGAGAYNYVYADQDGKTGFYNVGTVITQDMTGKAYLQTSKSIKPTTGARVAIVFDEDVTGISSVARETVANNEYYNLSGQRIAQPTRGLYIVNGKKVAIK